MQTIIIETKTLDTDACPTCLLAGTQIKDGYKEFNAPRLPASLLGGDKRRRGHNADFTAKPQSTQSTQRKLKVVNEEKRGYREV